MYILFIYIPGLSFTMRVTLIALFSVGNSLKSWHKSLLSEPVLSLAASGTVNVSVSDRVYQCLLVQWQCGVAPLVARVAAAALVSHFPPRRDASPRSALSPCSVRSPRFSCKHIFPSRDKLLCTFILFYDIWWFVFLSTVL